MRRASCCMPAFGRAARSSTGGTPSGPHPDKALAGEAKATGLSTAAPARPLKRIIHQQRSLAATSLKAQRGSID